MRFVTRLHSEGEQRTVTFFAWLPIELCQSEEIEVCRWLEKVTVLQEWKWNWESSFGWQNVRFVDE